MECFGTETKRARVGLVFALGSQPVPETLLRK
jgi:hypothetical protein